MGRKIIELIYVYREQEGYFQIAKECNFEEAEKFRAMDAVNSEFRGRIKEKIDKAKKEFRNTADYRVASKHGTNKVL